MQIHIFHSMSRITVSATNGMPANTAKVKALPTRPFYRKRIFIIPFLVMTALLPFLFIVTAIDGLEYLSECSSLDCVWLNSKKLITTKKPPQPQFDFLKEMVKVLSEANNEAMPEEILIPNSLQELLDDFKTHTVNAKTFAYKLKALVQQMEEKASTAKQQEYLYKQYASNGIPNGMHCLTLKLADEYSSNAHARIQLPSPELVPRLMDNSYNHFVMVTDNVLAASVVVSSTIKNFAKPEKLVFHIITDRKTYASMHAWFALHPLQPSIIEVKGVHQFDWLTKYKVPILEAMKTHLDVRGYQNEDHTRGARFTYSLDNLSTKLQTQSPKYISILNHLQIYLPELFPSLHKVVFLDDDVVVQHDLSPLWNIDLQGKVNGAVETCSSRNPRMRSRTLKSFLNFSHPLIGSSFDPNQCAWAFGMNIFDLQAWRKTNISDNYHYWIKRNFKYKMQLWHLGVLPPALIAFNGYVHPINSSWHLFGLGYQARYSRKTIAQAAVIHYNGQSKPWLDIAFPKLRAFWSKYVDLSDSFIQNCNIMV